MPPVLRQPSFCTALIAASIGLAGAHAPAFAAPSDSTFVVETCPKKGRDPFAAMYTHSCGVSRPGGFTSAAPWKSLELMAIDQNPHGDAVVATLKCMSRKSGEVSAVAVVKSVRSLAGPKITTAPLPTPLDFDLCAYFLSVVVNGTSAPAQALMVSLRH